MILMPQIFDVTANENARYKHNELELLFVARFQCLGAGSLISLSVFLWTYNYMSCIKRKGGYGNFNFFFCKVHFQLSITMKVFIEFTLIPLKIKCHSILQKRLSRTFDISNILRHLRHLLALCWKSHKPPFRLAQLICITIGWTKL